MHVLFNTYPVAFDCPGGGEIQLLKTKEALERLGVEVSLFDIWNPQMDRYDVVHYFSVQGGSANFCNHIKRRGMPLVISPILWLGDNDKDYPLDEIRHLLHLADLALPNSHRELARLSEFFSLPAERFAVVHNGIDPIFSRTVKDRLLFRRTFVLPDRFILCVGNIEPRKNQLSLVRALGGLDADVPLVVIGNIRDRGYFQQCLTEAEGRMLYLGYFDHADTLLLAAYQECEIFVLPSLFETPGLAALEAAAAGAKIVITEGGSTGEYFGGDVSYVNPSSVEDIRAGILRETAAIRDSTLSERVRKFTWGQAAIETLEAYNKAIQGYERR